MSSIFKLSVRLAGAAALLAAALAPAAADCGPPPASDAALIAEPAAVAAIAEAAAMPNATGRLWRVETDPPSHIVGTFHVAAGGIAEPGPVLSALVQGASGLYLELETDHVRTDFARWSADPANIFRGDGTRLTDTMDEAERDHAASVLAHYGMPLAVADTLKPMMLLGLLSVPPCALTLGGEPGLDQRLEALALAAGIEVEALETIDEQIAAMEAEPAMMDHVIRMMLAVGLENLDLWFTNLALYRTRNIGALWTLGLAGMEDIVSPEEAETIAAVFWDRMVSRRNAVMVERMVPGLREGGKVVAVGALHLPGEDGIVALLEDAGFALTPVADDPPSAIPAPRLPEPSAVPPPSGVPTPGGVPTPDGEAAPR